MASMIGGGNGHAEYVETHHIPTKLSIGVDIETNRAAHLIAKQQLLLRTVSSLKDHLIEEGKHVDQERASQLAKQRGWEEILALRLQDIDAASRDILDLDTTEYVPLKVQGETEYKVGYRLRHLTHDYTFNLTTKFPIRKVTPEIASKSSKWQIDPRDWPIGDRQLNVVLKNHPLRSASASIALYGWRKEIHGERLSRTKSRRREATLTVAQLAIDIGTSSDQISRLATTNASYKRAVDACLNDLQILNQRPCYPGISKSRLFDFVNADTAFGIATLLGLKSRVQKSDALFRPYISDAEAPREMLRGRIGLLTDFEEYVKSMSAFRREVTVKGQLRETKLGIGAKAALYIEDDLELPYTPRRVKRELLMQKAGEDEEQTTLCQDGIDTVARLDSSFASFRSGYLSLLEELRQDREATSQLADELRSAETFVIEDKISTAKTVAMLESDSLPIGALASLIECIDASAAWAAVVRGHRIS